MKWDEFFLDIAATACKKSKDPSTQTGCCIARDNRVLAVGYNGFPTGVRDIPERYQDRGLKLQLISHSEANAIFSAARHGISLKGGTLYGTFPPCNECMKAIIQVGIVKVVWPRDSILLDVRWKESFSIARLMAGEAGIELQEV